MDYEKAYKEALALAKSYYGKGTNEFLDTIFPELAESEDERIRKGLVDFLQSPFIKENFTDEKVAPWIAYLEKQKEQNSDTEEYTDFTIYHPLKNGKGEYEYIPYSFYGSLTSFSENKDLIDFLHTCFYTKEECEEWIEKQKEQKPKQSEMEKEYVRTLHSLISDFLRGKCGMRGIDREYYQKIWDWLDNRHIEQKEQIPYIDFVIKPHKGDDNNPYDMSVSEAQDYAIKREFGIPFNDGEVYVDERHMTQTIGNILRWADEHPKEQKPDIEICSHSIKSKSYSEQKPAEKQDYSGLTDFERAIHRGFLSAGTALHR